jgi:hypothetical protein
VSGSFDFANPSAPVIKSFQNERNLQFWGFEKFQNQRTFYSGFLKNFGINEPRVFRFLKILKESVGIMKDRQRIHNLGLGSLTQCFDFAEPQVRVETGSTTSENHWLRVKTSYLTFAGQGYTYALPLPT